MGQEREGAWRHKDPKDWITADLKEYYLQVLRDLEGARVRHPESDTLVGPGRDSSASRKGSHKEETE